MNKTKWSGVTALHRAAAEGHSDVIEYLVKKAGADPSAKTTFGWHTPLHFAARNGKEDACIALIENGATWQVFNKDRETPQHWARTGGHANMGRKLEQVVNQQASRHRKAKVKEMEAMYDEKRRNTEEDRKAEEDEAKRLEDEVRWSEERGAKRRASNAIASDKNQTCSYFCTRRAFSIITAISLVPYPNSFRDSLRSSQLEEQKLANYQRSIDANSSTNTGEDTNDHLHSKDMAQLPVNLPAIEYVKMGRKQVFIYNKLINRNLIVKPKRFGANSEHPSIYVTRNKVSMPGVTDSSIQAVGELSRHFRKTRQTREMRRTTQVRKLENM